MLEVGGTGNNFLKGKKFGCRWNPIRWKRVSWAREGVQDTLFLPVLSKPKLVHTAFLPRIQVPGQCPKHLMRPGVKDQGSGLGHKTGEGEVLSVNPGSAFSSSYNCDSISGL